MLRTLLENGLVPSRIIQEVSKVGDEERDKFFKRMSGQPVPPRINQLITGRDIPLYSVANHNDDACLELIKADEPDLLILGGTRIIKPHILEIPRLATLNAHPGLLPWLRGSASVGWALYKDLPQGASSHFVEPGIDTGDIIISRQLPVYRDDSYESLNYRVALLAGELMAESINAFLENDVPRTPQDTSLGETLKVIPEDLLQEGIQRLVEGRYSHYVD
jgi:methionyl-tRNA formyltransferase